MKANEFVRKYGLDYAKRDVAAYESGFITKSDFTEHFGFDLLDDLKRLVESHDFVSANGGIEGARKYLNNQDPNRTSKHYNALRARLDDVESCMEGVSCQ